MVSMKFFPNAAVYLCLPPIPPKAMPMVCKNTVPHGSRVSECHVQIDVRGLYTPHPASQSHNFGGQ